MTAPETALRGLEPGYQYATTLGADYPRRLARSWLRAAAPVYTIWIVVGIAAGLLAASLIFGDAPAPLAVPVVAVVAGAFGAGGTVAWQMGAVRKDAARKCPPGSVYEVRLTDDALSLRVPYGASQMRYELLKSATRRGDAVVVRFRPRGRIVLWAGVLPGDSVEQLQRQIEAHRASAP